MRTFLVSFFLFFILFWAGCVSTEYQSRDTSKILPSTIQSFQVIPNATICTQEGKPIIRMYSTTTCPHCRWVASTFNGVMDEYVKAGKVVAMHWDFDVGNDQLTPQKESAIPLLESELFKQTNPEQSVPTYLFGCKYYRVGNAFETKNDLDAEAAEFKAVIEKLLTETKTK